MSLNKVMLIGHLGADPEIRRSQSGKPIVSFNLATSERWRDATTGERREITDWHRIVIFSENLAKIAEQYLKKGSKIFLEGQMKTRKWTNQAGQDQYTTEVVCQGFNATITLLDKREGSGYRLGGDGPESYGLPPDRATGPDYNDDIPF